MEEKQDVTPESSSALGEAIASSPEAQEQIDQQVQGTETVTPQQTVSPEQPEQQVEDARVPYSRLKDVVDEKNYWREMAMKQSQIHPQPQPQQPTQDPFAGMTPDEERFWRAVDARAEKIAEGKIRQISPVIDAGRQELATMKVQQFRTAHPDIKANSPEEIAIAERISSGYLPEDAYRAVMWDSRVTSAEKQANNQVKQRIEAKKQANVEQRSIPQGASPPTKDKLTLRQRINKAAEGLDLS